MAESTVDPLLMNSSVYQEFLAEREEINKHKWFRSEEAGHDIGFEAALVDWMLKHRAEWRARREDGPASPSRSS
jgi:hypothetical protein